VQIKYISLLALTYSRNQQHEHDSGQDLHHMVVLLETECQGKGCTVQSYRTHRHGMVLQVQLLHDHLNNVQQTTA